MRGSGSSHRQLAELGLSSCFSASASGSPRSEQPSSVQPSFDLASAKQKIAGASASFPLESACPSHLWPLEPLPWQTCLDHCSFLSSNLSQHHWPSPTCHSTCLPPYLKHDPFVISLSNAKETPLVKEQPAVSALPSLHILQFRQAIEFLLSPLLGHFVQLSCWLQLYQMSRLNLASSVEVLL